MKGEKALSEGCQVPLAARRINRRGPSLLQKYALRAMAEAAIDLAVGELEGEPKPEVVAAIKECLARPHHAGYTAASGTNELLEAVVERLQAVGLEATTDQVVFSHGAKTLFTAALEATTTSGKGKVFWFSPGYPPYDRASRILGRRPIEMRGRPSLFDPEPDHLQRILDNFVVKEEKGGLWTNVVVINNPVNPTGTELVGLEEIAEVISRFPVYVIADETYAELYDDSDFGTFQPFSVYEEMVERTITLRSLSKEARIPGYRCGYGCGPAPVIAAMRTILGETIGCPSLMAQAAAIASFPLIPEYTAEARRNLKPKRELIKQWCAEQELEFVPPEAAFYAFINFGPALRRLGYDSTTKFADRLLSEERVGIIPGPAFGSTPELHDWARLSYGGPISNVEEGLSRIAKLIE